jgi:hypothetical protein
VSRTPFQRVQVPFLKGIDQGSSPKNVRPPNATDIVNLRYNRIGALQQRQGTAALNDSLQVNAAEEPSGLFADESSVKILTAENAYWYDVDSDAVRLCTGYAAGAQVTRIQAPPVVGELVTYDTDYDPVAGVLGIVYYDTGLLQTMVSFISAEGGALLRRPVAVPATLARLTRILSLGNDNWALIGANGTFVDNGLGVNAAYMIWTPNSDYTSATSLLRSEAQMLSDHGGPINPTFELSRGASGEFISSVSGLLQRHDALSGIILQEATAIAPHLDMTALGGRFYTFGNNGGDLELWNYDLSDLASAPVTTVVSGSLPYWETDDVGFYSTLGQLRPNGTDLQAAVSISLSENPDQSGISGLTNGLINGAYGADNDQKTWSFLISDPSGTPTVTDPVMRHGFSLVAKCKGTGNIDVLAISPDVLRGSSDPNFGYAGLYLARIGQRDSFAEGSVSTVDLRPGALLDTTGNGETDTFTGLYPGDLVAEDRQITTYSQPSWHGLNVLARLGTAPTIQSLNGSTTAPVYIGGLGQQLPKFFSLSNDDVIVPLIEPFQSGTRLVLARINFDLKERVPEAEEPRGLVTVTGGLLNIFDNSTASEYAVTQAPAPAIIFSNSYIGLDVSDNIAGGFQRAQTPGDAESYAGGMGVLSDGSLRWGVRMRYGFQDSRGLYHNGPQWWNGSNLSAPEVLSLEEADVTVAEDAIYLDWVARHGARTNVLGFLVPPPITNREFENGENYYLEVFVLVDGNWRGKRVYLTPSRYDWVTGYYFVYVDPGNKPTEIAARAPEDFALQWLPGGGEYLPLSLGAEAGREPSAEPLNAVADIAVSRDRLFALDFKGRDIFYSKPYDYTSNDFPEFSGLQVLNTDGQGGAVVAIEAMDDKLCLFKENSVEVVFVGQGPNRFGLGPALQSPRIIPSDGGCISKGSVITAPPGIFFQSQAGLYLLTRQLQLRFIGRGVEDITDENLIRNAVVVPMEKEVLFLYGDKNAITYNYVDDTWVRYTNFPSQAGAVWNENLYLLDRDNYITRATGTSDFAPGGTLRLDTSLDSGWVVPDGTSPHFKVQEIQIRGQKTANNTLQVQYYLDYNSTPVETFTVLAEDGSSWAATSDDSFLVRLKPNTGKCSAFRVRIYTETGSISGGHVIEGIDLFVYDTGLLSKAGQTGAS